jgi:hypothetical protein
MTDDARPCASEPPGGLDAVEHRHADVHDDHVGPLAEGELDAPPSWP